jgi:hypothetical protein
LIHAVGTERAFPDFVFLGVVDQRVIRANLNTLLTAVANPLINENNTVLSPGYRFNRTRRQA